MLRALREANKEGMAKELEGKVAIVTGGASGIGRGTVEKFVAEGAKVVIADVDRERGELLAAGYGADALYRRTDVTDSVDVRGVVAFAVENFGGLHVMMNNAGVSGIHHPHLLDEDFADFDRVMAIDLLGVMLGTREAARHMARSGGGSIINISSIGGMRAVGGPWAYHAAKAAVIAFSQTAAVDLGEHGIRVNCVAPANIETEILGAMLGKGMTEDEQAEFMKRVRASILAIQPIKRQGTTNDVAEAALFFASDRSSYVTGTLMPVDAGIVAGSPARNPGFDESARAG
jgi:NAD(P)-dependent dehydrogenase (short-subunit alcohol dehydrogenase family)